MRRCAVAVLGAIALAGAAAAAGDGPYVTPAPRDKCPVCGMFVARYPEWIGGVRFADGGYAVFDGAKDLFRFWHDVPRYAPTRKQADVTAIFVTDYYAVRQVDARTAWFVVGSDVLGPMGRELVPFASGDEAGEFLLDHHGKRVLRFSEVTPALLAELQ